MKMLFKQCFTVTATDTAAHLQSGSLPVLSTPILIAWMEKVAFVLAQENLDDNHSTVGIGLDVKHLKASLVGEQITCIAEVKEIDGRKTTFEITCFNQKDEMVGVAKHERFVIDIHKFMEKLQ